MSDFVVQNENNQGNLYPEGRYKRWSEENLKVMRNEYWNTPTKELADKLKKTCSAVKEKASSLGLKKGEDPNNLTSEIGLNTLNSGIDGKLNLQELYDFMLRSGFFRLKMMLKYEEQNKVTLPETTKMALMLLNHSIKGMGLENKFKKKKPQDMRANIQKIQMVINDMMHKLEKNLNPEEKEQYFNLIRLSDKRRREAENKQRESDNSCSTQK